MLMMKNENEVSKCYACDQVGDTKEHVPPKCFFPKDQRENLLTVPSCKKHNCRKSSSDQLMMNFFLRLKDINSDELKSRILYVNHENPSRGYFYVSNFEKKISYNNIILFLDTFSKAIYRKITGKSAGHAVAGYLYHKKTNICFEFGYHARVLDHIDELSLFEHNRNAFHISMLEQLDSHDCLVEIGDNRDIFFAEYLSLEDGRFEVIKSTFYNEIEVWSEIKR